MNYDEASGRLRLADFLYAEYSLEEVIYQLAKVINWLTTENRMKFNGIVLCFVSFLT